MDDLDTIAGARRWLVDPKNWHETNLFILKWNGMTPTVNKRHGQRLIDNPHDDGLAWCVVYERKLRRGKRDRGEEIDERETEPSNVTEEEV